MQAEDARFALAEMVSWNDAGEEIAVFDGARQRYFAFNAGAVAIWRELAAGRSIAETIDTLAARFDSPRAAIAEDIAAFVRDAIDRQLLVAHE